MVENIIVICVKIIQHRNMTSNSMNISISIYSPTIPIYSLTIPKSQKYPQLFASHSSRLWTLLHPCMSLHKTYYIKVMLYHMSLHDAYYRLCHIICYNLIHIIRAGGIKEQDSFSKNISFY